MSCSSLQTNSGGGMRTWRMVRVLVWKYWVVKRREFCCGMLPLLLLEIAIPAVVCLLLLWTRTLVDTTWIPLQHYTSSDTDSGLSGFASYTPHYDPIRDLSLRTFPQLWYNRTYDGKHLGLLPDIAAHIGLIAIVVPPAEEKDQTTTNGFVKGREEARKRGLEFRDFIDMFIKKLKNGGELEGGVIQKDVTAGNLTRVFFGEHLMDEYVQSPSYGQTLPKLFAAVVFEAPPTLLHSLSPTLHPASVGEETGEEEGFGAWNLKIRMNASTVGGARASVRATNRPATSDFFLSYKGTEAYTYLNGSPWGLEKKAYPRGGFLDLQTLLYTFVMTYTKHQQTIDRINDVTPLSAEASRFVTRVFNGTFFSPPSFDDEDRLELCGIYNDMRDQMPDGFSWLPYWIQHTQRTADLPTPPTSPCKSSLTIPPFLPYNHPTPLISTSNITMTYPPPPSLSPPVVSERIELVEWRETETETNITILHTDRDDACSSWSLLASLTSRDFPKAYQSWFYLGDPSNKATRNNNENNLDTDDSGEAVRPWLWASEWGEIEGMRDSMLRPVFRIHLKRNVSHDQEGSSAVAGNGTHTAEIVGRFNYQQCYGPMDTISNGTELDVDRVARRLSSGDTETVSEKTWKRTTSGGSNSSSKSSSSSRSTSVQPASISVPSFYSLPQPAAAAQYKNFPNTYFPSSPVLSAPSPALSSWHSLTASPQLAHAKLSSTANSSVPLSGGVGGGIGQGGTGALPVWLTALVSKCEVVFEEREELDTEQCQWQKTKRSSPVEITHGPVMVRWLDSTVREVAEKFIPFEWREVGFPTPAHMSDPLMQSLGALFGFFFTIVRLNSLTSVCLASTCTHSAH
eukprot:GHVQ01028743.1.p1 GENE.GHVQ01028743.1~~GHVQ01028743.1.p1  ORF type:complete len:853 (-),score=149.95 GHVQ01028743.1:72-2630(-)